MKLPKQVPAVERKVNKLASVPAGAKVGPSSFVADWLYKFESPTDRAIRELAARSPGWTVAPTR